jgi:hypothetical protein
MHLETKAQSGPPHLSSCSADDFMMCMLDSLVPTLLELEWKAHSVYFVERLDTQRLLQNTIGEVAATNINRND